MGSKVKVHDVDFQGWLCAVFMGLGPQISGATPERFCIGVGLVLTECCREEAADQILRADAFLMDLECHLAGIVIELFVVFGVW